MTDDATANTTELVAYQPPSLAIAFAKQRREGVKQAMREVLEEGTDFGQVKGIDRPTLLLPGAETLLQVFRFSHELTLQEIERDAAGEWLGVTYRCAIFDPIASPPVLVATCDGYAGYDEAKFYKAADSKRGAWRAPRHNLVMMAQKRALVAATRRATASSGLFTSDVGEDESEPVDRTREELVAEVRRLAASVPKGQLGALRETVAQAALPPTPAESTTVQLVRVVEIIHSFTLQAPFEADESPAPPSGEAGGEETGRPSSPRPHPLSA